MYIPKSKQKKGGKLDGNLIDPKTGALFTGKFVMDFLGRFFKGDKITNDSQPLDFIPFSNSSDADKYGSEFYSVFRQPSEEDYQKGTFDRYFIKDGRTGKIIEVDKVKYLTQKKESKLYKRVLKIQWYITGNPDDQLINGYIYPGTKSKNQDVINQAEEILPGIGDQILKDPKQFVK